MTIRKATLLVGVAAGVAVALLMVLGGGGGTALADGGPHVVESGATPDKCAACHRIHTGQNEYLLKEAGTVEDFCFSCHGNGGPGSDLAVQEGTFYGGTAPGDPYGGKTASDTVGLRAGGFEEARINTTDSTASTIGVLATAETVNSRHTLETLTTLWGNGAVGTVGAGPSYTLECTSCHDPHGNGNYRILRTIPTGSGGAGYAIPDTYPKTYTTANYFNMYFGANPTNPMTEPPGAVAGTSILYDTSNWCAQCHTRYLAESGTSNALNPNPKPNSEGSRVDSGDAIYTYRHTSEGYGFSSYGGSPGFKYSNRACITCHATHGSNSEMPGGATGTTYSSTVEWPDGSLANPTDPTRASLLKMDNRGMCRKCHSSVQ